MIAPPIDASELDALFGVFEGRSHVGLAVSGGSDSMALMHLAARWRVGKGADAPILSVLTVDHGLRPESPEEAAAVARAATALGLAATVLRWGGPKPGSGLQAAARAARYDLLVGHAHANGLDAIATAHHLDDQAETLLMRLARGSGVDGLAAMAVESAWAGIPLLRPLLDVPKDRLVATLRAGGVTWLEDPSNACSRYERNRLRAARAELERLGFSAEALALTARRMRRAREALDATTDRFLAEHVRMTEAGYCHLPRASLVAAPEEIALRAVSRILAAVGGRDAPPRLARLESLLQSLRSGACRARTLAGCRIVAAADEIAVLREPGREGLPELTLAPGATALWDRRFRVTAPAALHGLVTVRALGTFGLRKVLAAAHPVALPPHGAGPDLVSFWSGGEVLSVPHLRYHAGAAAAEGRRPAGACVAQFVNAGLLGCGRAPAHPPA